MGLLSMKIKTDPQTKVPLYEFSKRHKFLEAAVLQCAQQMVIFVKCLAHAVPKQQQFAHECNNSTV